MLIGRAPATEDDYYEAYTIFNKQKPRRKSLVELLQGISFQELDFLELNQSEDNIQILYFFPPSAKTKILTSKGFCVSDFCIISGEKMKFIDHGKCCSLYFDDNKQYEISSYNFTNIEHKNINKKILLPNSETISTIKPKREFGCQRENTYCLQNSLE